jgi:hypothetical protein
LAVFTRSRTRVIDSPACVRASVVAASVVVIGATLTPS